MQTELCGSPALDFAHWWKGAEVADPWETNYVEITHICGRQKCTTAALNSVVRAPNKTAFTLILRESAKVFGIKFLIFFFFSPPRRERRGTDGGGGKKKMDGNGWRENCTYRFLTLVIPLKAFRGTAWIWFSLRSLEGEKVRGRR